MIAKIETSIISRLNGHLAAFDKASGVTLEPTLSPMQINANCLIGFGIEKGIPIKAIKVDMITGQDRHHIDYSTHL